MNSTEALKILRALADGVYPITGEILRRIARFNKHKSFAPCTTQSKRLKMLPGNQNRQRTQRAG